MPKSKVRKKSVYTPPEGVLQSHAARARAAQPSPRWYAILMVALMKSRSSSDLAAWASADIVILR